MISLDSQRTELLHIAMQCIGLENASNPKVYLGGGTVLAGLWRHRVSTDIDLFTTQRIYSDLVEKNLPTIRQRATSADIEIRPHASLLICKTKLGEFSIGGGEDATGYPSGGNFEATSGIEVHSILEILMRKIRARMLRTPRYLLRDAYDVACCAIYEPQVVEHFDDWISPIDREQLARDRVDPTLQLDDSAPLNCPAHPNLADLTNLRDVLFRILLREFDDLASINRLARLD